ncbi:unnamed protein product (macronuclear) [Paramecium tetraurelia]|uniref:Mitochondrial import inner membrane translocase subunit n=1 Tax=Paramecium tetraurelia TaxID=5888 RepID=A0D5P4_PARTE|nr:uncharacterized protein GSPATT00013791001 [Paramecium tetraurelia]CAK78361.1 unnamed protein product [Paramecium tetraurelia]|eukprot:XP_001445758.1 hypothetical protein (macronuclear) [Paramecium tetraurelia strain d4-2]
MFKPNFSGQSKSLPQDDFEKYIKTTLQENYYMTCLDTCFADYSTPICMKNICISLVAGQEKVCLAKCLDRAYDSLRLVQKIIDPFDNMKQKKFYYKLDGQNVLGLKKDQML